MSESFVTDKQILEWFDDLETALKNSIVDSPVPNKEAREEAYLLYQAAQLLKARFFQELRKEVEMPDYQYDPD